MLAFLAGPSIMIKLLCEILNNYKLHLNHIFKFYTPQLFPATISVAYTMLPNLSEHCLARIALFWTIFPDVDINLKDESNKS